MRTLQPEFEMKTKIINWSLISLAVFLTACGGSDTPTSASTDTTTTPKETINDDGTPTIEFGDPEANVGIGYGIGNDHSPGIVKPAITTLSAGGSTSVTANIVDKDDGNKIYLGQRTIAFNSYCSQLGLAEFSPATVQASGLAISNYQDKGCGQIDNIFVSIVEEQTSEDGEVSTNVVATATANIDVKLPVVGAVNFMEAEPMSIALQGVGSANLPEMSTLSFQVLDRSGNPMFAQEVRFAMDHIVGGASLARNTAVTGLDGVAKIQLFSGKVNGTVRVSATVDVDDEDGNYLTTISTQSNPIGMVTGLPDINSFSISADIYNPAAWDLNGTDVKITARAADHYQNPVPDGTIVAFSAEGGSVTGTCETSNGGCSVTWTSQNPRPIDGIATVFARTVGVSDYQDKNSNGVFDLGEQFMTQGEGFLDANGNGVFDNEGLYNQFVDFDRDGTADVLWDESAYNFYEEFFDFNNNGVLDPAPTKYQGVSCSDAAIADGHCSSLGVVTDSIQLMMSEVRSPLIEGPFLLNESTGRYEEEVACLDVSGLDRNIMWRVSDSAERRNELANGSTISFQSDSWVKYYSGGGIHKIGNEFAPERFDLWEQRPEHSSKSDAQKKYDYLNMRGHVHVINLGRDNTIDDYEDVGFIAATVSYFGDDTEKSIPISAVGKVYLQLSKLDGSIVSSVDVSSGPDDYILTVTTPCGEGLEKGAVIAFGFDNGTISGISSSEGINQSNASGGTIVVSEDRRAGGNTIQFSINSDGVSSEMENAITVVTRFGQASTRSNSLMKIKD